MDIIEAPWMYEPSGEIKKIISSSKKCPIFSHEYRPHIEYFVNKTKQEEEIYLEWEFTPLNKAWMTLEGIKKYRSWKNK